jgi:hypothetical protein
VSGSDPLRGADGRFREPTATERFARLAPVHGGATGDLDWLDRALAPARRRAAAVDGPVPDPEPPTPEPAPPPEPSHPAGTIVPAGPQGRPRTADPVRDAIRRYWRQR